MSDDSPGSAAVQRGMILVQQGRFPEGRAYLQQAVAADPNDAQALALLATCEYRIDGEETAALATIERALALEPLEPRYHALRAWILLALKRPRPALAGSAEALRIDPACDMALTATAAAHLQLENWLEAEQAARRALEIDPDDTDAANLLGEALRIQGRREETDAHIGVRLARDPLDPRTHASAGWAALQNGERERAEEHFVEALRLDPHLSVARSGLLEAYKARSPFYRGYLRWAFATARLGQRRQWMLLLGLYFGSRFLRAALGRAGIIVGVLYLLFVLWTYLSSAIGNTLLLLDRRARLALSNAEQWEGLVVGTTLVLGLVLLVVGVATGVLGTRELGLGLVGSAIPFALTFTNESARGRWLFGAIGVVSILAGILAAAGNAWGNVIPSAVTRNVSLIAFIGVVATTWLGNVRSLRR